MRPALILVFTLPVFGQVIEARHKPPIGNTPALLSSGASSNCNVYTCTVTLSGCSGATLIALAVTGYSGNTASSTNTLTVGDGASNTYTHATDACASADCRYHSNWFISQPGATTASMTFSVAYNGGVSPDSVYYPSLTATCWGNTTGGATAIVANGTNSGTATLDVGSIAASGLVLLNSFTDTGAVNSLTGGFTLIVDISSVVNIYYRLQFSGSVDPVITYNNVNLNRSASMISIAHN